MSCILSNMKLYAEKIYINGKNSFKMSSLLLNEKNDKVDYSKMKQRRAGEHFWATDRCIMSPEYLSDGVFLFWVKGATVLWERENEKLNVQV